MKLIGLREIPQNTVFKEGDIFILFGELFGRGYVNGLLKEAKECKMRIIGLTVGRRDADKTLRALSEEELKEAEKNLGGEIINIPLEAGFDLESVDGVSPVNMIDAVDKNQWREAKLDNERILACKQAAQKKFCKKLEQFMEILEQKIPADKNIFFAHTMAGGIIRAKLFFIIANKVFKGKGERFESSQKYWNSDIGQLCAKNFDSVTADTFDLLLRFSKKIRERNEANGASVFYSAYGYHGCEIYIQDKLQWQTYVPYQQGHAKKRLENFAVSARSQNIQASVFNCPEIRTNSSSIFLGVELSLFFLFVALRKHHPSSWSEEQWKICQDKLPQEIRLEDILEELEECIMSAEIQENFSFENWPTENSPVFSEKIISISEKITKLHKDRKDLISDYLSNLVVEATGSLIFQYASSPKEAVIWLGHDIIAKSLAHIYSKQARS